MPWRNGLYVRLQSWVARAAAGAPISAVEFDADGNDEASALNNCVLRDGTGAPTADLPMANHSLTGIRQAVAAGEPMEFAQVKALIAAAGGAVANRLHNASFLVNQRAVAGNVSLGNAAYGHDRWKGGASGCTYSFAVVGADVQISIGSGSLQQIVPAPDVDNATMTLSNAGTAQARVYPTGGTPPAFASCPVTATNLVPGQSAVVEFSTGTVLEPQLEVGATAHGFARRPYPMDALLCQAFYERLPFSINQTVGNNNTSFWTPFFFRAQKYAAPTIAVTLTSNPLGNSVTVSNQTTDGFTLNFTGSGSSFLVVGVATVSCEP